MFASLAVAFGFALSSALIPVINTEILLIALVAREPELSPFAVGVAVAMGQMTGKLVYYYAARGSLRLPAFLQRRPKRDRPLTPRRARWQQRTKRVRAWLERITEKCHQHPHWMAGTYGVSALVGIPPFMASTILCGLVRMSLVSFLTVGLVGRSIRFIALAASPALISSWFF